MAFRIRLMCILVWTSVTLMFLYYVYYQSGSWHLMYGTFFQEDKTNTSLRPYILPENSSPSARVPLKNIQVITNKKSEETQLIDKTTKGILTEAVYESGHDIINADLCPNLGELLDLFVGITSAPNHGEARMAIRQTWGHYALRRDVSLAFIIGNSKEPNVNSVIAKESGIYGDIIRGNFVDSYNNLTLKTVSFLEWIDTHCSKASFILKTDDDMFINFEKLLNFLKAHSRLKTKKTIFGRLAKKWKPIRNSRSKYFVSVGQFSPTVYPDFTTGPAYLFTSDIVHDLYKMALNHTYLKLEDVFTTGIVAQSVGVKRVHVNEFVNKKIPFNVCNIKKNISIHMVRFHEQFDLWKKLLDGRSKCK